MDGPNLVWIVVPVVIPVDPARSHADGKSPLASTGK
jgi:hypothetical protein